MQVSRLASVSNFLTAVLLLLSSATFGANRVVELTTTNTVVFSGEVSQQSVNKATEQLIDLVLKRRFSSTIYLVLDSPGGSIDAGEQFIQFAKTIPNLETVTIFAASMASAISQALPGNRLITENGTQMFHRAKGGFQGQFESGEVESRLGYAKQIVFGLESRNAARMQMDILTYKAAIKDELWLYGKFAVDAKVADEVIDLKCSKQLIKQEVVSTISIMGMFEVDIVKSGCPLLQDMKVLEPSQPSDTENLATYQSTYRQSGVLRFR